MVVYNVGFILGYSASSGNEQGITVSSDKNTRQQVFDFLHAHNVLNLATTGDDGVWAAAVYYAHEKVEHGVNLCFLSSPNARHVVNLRANPQVAGTIQRDQQQWHEIKGIQLFGQTVELDGNEAEQAMNLYDAKHKLLGEDAPEALRNAIAHIKWYRLEIEQLLLIDNTKGFGHREAVELR